MSLWTMAISSLTVAVCLAAASITTGATIVKILVTVKHSILELKAAGQGCE